MSTPGALQELKLAVFGPGSTGLTTVGYTLINDDHTISTPRTTEGVYEVQPGTGMYAAVVTFEVGWSGTVLWDTGTEKPAYAAETFFYLPSMDNTEAVLMDIHTMLTGVKADVTLLKEDVDFLRDISGGRWKIANNQMIFFKEDNITEVARFNLFDSTARPTNTNVFDRVKVK